MRRLVTPARGRCILDASLVAVLRLVRRLRNFADVYLSDLSALRYA